MSLPDKWIIRYLDLAETVSAWSKDPSTKCGAVLVRPDKTIASVGFNGFPRGVKDDSTVLMNRELKYKIILHAEENVFSNCKDPSVEGYSLFIYPFMPCSKCAALIVNNKVAHVYAPKTPKEKEERWKESFDITSGLFRQAGTTLTLLS